MTSITPGLLGGKPTIDPSYGFTSQAIGHRAALDLLHLHLPWWNPYEGTGMPLAGETQAAALFPPTLLTAFSDGQLYEHILLELIAGICTYLLLMRIGVTRLAAVAGGIAFALCGKFAWFADADGQSAGVPSHAPAGDRVGGRRDAVRPARRLATDRGRRRPGGVRRVSRGRLHQHADGGVLDRAGAVAASVARCCVRS